MTSQAVGFDDSDNLVATRSDAVDATAPTPGRTFKGIAGAVPTVSCSVPQPTLTMVRLAVSLVISLYLGYRVARLVLRPFSLRSNPIRVITPKASTGDEIVGNHAKQRRRPMSATQSVPVPNPLSAVVGHDPEGAPVVVTLTGGRPHARWAGAAAAGKSSQLQLVTRQLISQIPAIPGRLRLVLFESAARDQTFAGLHDLDGVLVMHPSSPFGPRAHAAGAAVQRLREEIDWRRSHPEAPVAPMVIAVDEYDRWRHECPLLSLIVTEYESNPISFSLIDTEPKGPIGAGDRITPINGIHLLLTSTSLGDFSSVPINMGAGSFQRRGQLRASSRYTTVVLPLHVSDIERYGSLLTALADLCGGSRPAYYMSAPFDMRAPREAYRLTSSSVTRFLTAQRHDEAVHRAS